MNDTGSVRFGYRFFAFHTYVGLMAFVFTLGLTYAMAHLSRFLPDLWGFFSLILIPTGLSWIGIWMFLFRVPITARFDFGSGVLSFRAPLGPRRVIPLASFKTWRRRSHKFSQSVVLYCVDGRHVTLPAYILDCRIYSTLRKSRIRYDGHEKRLLFFFLPSKRKAT